VVPPPPQQALQGRRQEQVVGLDRDAETGDHSHDGGDCRPARRATLQANGGQQQVGKRQAHHQVRALPEIPRREDHQRQEHQGEDADALAAQHRCREPE
jgi:hypothetical protein